MNRLYVWGIVVVIVSSVALFILNKPKENTVTTEHKIEQPTPPKMEINPDATYTAVFDTTAGRIVVTLFAKETPKTVNNFVHLARKGFYNNTIFHRVIKGFMIQGGDPKGTGSGGPGYRIEDEPFTGEYARGVIAMANTGVPNSAGSQFFIMHQDFDLPKTYVIFGKVTEGMGVVDAIATAETLEDGRENSRPVHPVTVKTISILESRPSATTDE